MLTDLEVDALINASREADEGPTQFVRRVERKVLEPAAPQAEPMTERDQFDLARWHQRLGELADAYYEAGRTNPARQRARADLMMHALDCATGWRARSAKAAQAAPAPQAAVQPLTDAQMLACVRSIGTPAPMGLTRDRGPYEVTEPTWFLTQLVRAIEHAHGITATAPRG